MFLALSPYFFYYQHNAFWLYRIFKNLSSCILIRTIKITEKYFCSFIIPLFSPVMSPFYLWTLLSPHSPVHPLKQKLHSQGTLVCHPHVGTQCQLPFQLQTTEATLEMLHFLQPCPPDGGGFPWKHPQSYFTSFLPTLLQIPLWIHKD